MDGYREHSGDFGLPAAAQASAADVPEAGDIAAVIGTDERRMHVRAYNYWVSLLGGRDYPSIEDLEPDNLNDFAANSVLLDFTAGRAHPATQYIGTAIRHECGLDDNVRTTADIPGRSLLSRLTDHYMQIIANCAPVGFEAEFVNHRGLPICYRGILMPFSSDGDTIDFIYGVINWKAAEGRDDAATGVPIVVTKLPEVEMILDAASDEDPGADDAGVDQAATDRDGQYPQVDLDPLHGLEDQRPREAEAIAVPEIQLDEEAGLADWLCAARETADEVKDADCRSRAALYKALGRAHDFALAARRSPDDYAELLEDSGVKARARAPMTPIVKLVFGIDYDKTRLTEFASALSHAQRLDVPLGGFEALIARQAGGLKALVAAERRARRPDSEGDGPAEVSRKRLRSAAELDWQALPDDEEFCLVVTRRGSDGLHHPVAYVADPILLDRAIRRSA